MQLQMMERDGEGLHLQSSRFQCASPDNEEQPGPLSRGSIVFASRRLYPQPMRFVQQYRCHDSASVPPFKPPFKFLRRLLP